MSATKIQTLFDKLLDDSYQIQTDTYLNRLQTHLVETNDEYGGPAKIPPEFLRNWLRQVLAQNNRLLTRPQIFTFILNFVAQRSSHGEFYAQNEQILAELLEFLYKYVNESGKIVNPSIKLGYIKIITSLINHGGGMDFLEKNPKYWQNIIAISHSDVSTLYINRECYRFIVKFLENTFDSCAQPTFVHRIIEEILRNFHANRSNLHARNETDVELARTYTDFKPSLQLLHQIVETTLKNRLFDIALIFIESYDLEAIAENLLLVSIAHVDFFQDLSKILLGIYFVRIYSEKCGETDAKYLDKILTLLRYNINKGYWQNMIKTLHLALVYCNNHHLVTVESLDKSNEGQLGDHILLLHLVPICCSPISNFVPENVDCIRDIFIAKVMKLMSENTLRLCYNWRDLLFSNQEYCFEASSLALACLMQSKNCMERNRAIIILQTFLYTLKDVLSDILTEKGPIEKFKSNATFYAQLFTAVREYTEQFQINWRDSVETICVLSLAIQYLELDFWPTNFQIEALKLTNTAIMKYMSPNMALLVDNTKNTTMGCIGGMLKSKIEGGEEWEVKDSALEVVCTVAHISKTKLIQILIDWLPKTLQKNYVKQPNLFDFVLEITAKVSDNEDTFLKLNINNFYIKIMRLAKQNIAIHSNNYVNLLKALLNHNSGLEFIMSTSFYEDLICKLYGLRQSDKSIEEFLTNLLLKTINVDLDFSSNVVRKVMEPIGDAKLRQSNPDAFLVNLALLSALLEFNINEIVLTRSNGEHFRILLLFYKYYHYIADLCTTPPPTNNKFEMFDLLKITFIMQYLEFYIQIQVKKPKMSEIGEGLDKIITNFNQNMCQGQFEQVLLFCQFGHLFWSLVAFKHAEHNAKIRNFTMSLTIVQLMPNFMLFKYCFPIPKFEEVYADDIRQEFLQKVFDVMTETEVRTCYTWRKYLMVIDDIINLALIALESIKSSRKYFDKPRAVMVVQGLMHMCQDFHRCGKLEQFVDEEKLFTTMFATLRGFLQSFNITWRDSLETTDLLSMCFDYLSIATWPESVVVELMRVVNVGIEKFMSPNLALLVDDWKSNVNSTVNLMGPLLYAKLMSVQGVRIRDEALRVCFTIANIAKKKFPSLQKVLMDSQLPQLVVKMMENETEEAFVRSTAMKCLQEMIQVDEIWESVLRNADLVPKVMKLLESEPEAQIRIEATNFLTIAYCNSLLASNEAKEQVYATLNRVALNDLHWEVKLEALNFWSKVIQMQLDDYGMIDGKFPNVTFSKEQKKIVVLNEMEIRKRLEKIMEFLYRVGCLNVLNESIWDDVANGGDVEVCKKAVEITNNLMGLLKQFNVKMHATNDDLLLMVAENGKECDRVKVTPRRFIEMNESQEKLDEIISGKMQWLNGMDDLDSLLDDMLQTYDGNDVNLMDCY